MRDEGTHLPTILLVTSDVATEAQLGAVCEDAFECLTCARPVEAMKTLKDSFVEVVLYDVADGEAPEAADLLREIAALWPETVRIALCDGTKTGALPDDLYQVLDRATAPVTLTRTLRNAVQLFRMRRDNDRMAFEMQFLSRKAAPTAAAPVEAANEGVGFEAILRSPASSLNATIAKARHLASFDVPILITGAAGTGKASLARAIHDTSLRSDKPFFSLNCSGLSDAQIKAELLGVRNNGAGRVGLIQKTGGGTLYLDGIDTLAADTQLWLARSMAEGHVMMPGHPDPQRLTLRLLTGSRTDLRALAMSGAFSEELYHACAVGLLSLPSLAERVEDIPVLAQHLLFASAARHGKSVRGISPEALEFLCRYDWPGNLRELENEITRMLIFAQDRILGPELVSRHILQAAPGDHDAEADAVIVGEGPLKSRVEEIEKRILREVLTRLKWNKTRAASELGLSRVGLRAKLDRYGLCPGVVETVGGDD